MGEVGTLGGLLNRFRDSLMAELRVSMPARVVAYDEAKQLVDVQPLLKETRRDAAGKELVEDLPLLLSCPVVSPYRIRGPIEKGDIVWVLFADRSIDQWLARGGRDAVDPVDPRRHHLSDAVAIPGVFHDVAGKPSIHFTETTLNLGEANPADFIALASKVLAELNAIRTAFNTHTHPTAPTGPVSPPTTLMGPAGSVASATVKAKD